MSAARLEDSFVGGEDEENVIVIMADNELIGVGMEYAHIRAEKCGCGGRWEVQEQQLLREGERWVDRISVRCEACGRERAFLFDVSNFFGKT